MIRQPPFLSAQKTSKPINTIPNERGKIGKGQVRRVSSSSFSSSDISLILPSSWQTILKHWTTAGGKAALLYSSYFLAKWWIIQAELGMPNTNVLGGLFNNKRPRFTQRHPEVHSALCLALSSALLHKCKTFLLIRPVSSGRGCSERVRSRTGIMDESINANPIATTVGNDL